MTIAQKMHALFGPSLSTAMCFAYEFSKSAIEQESEQCQSLHADGLVFVYKHLLQCVNINTVMLRLLEPRKKNRIWNVELDIYWHTFNRFFQLHRGQTTTKHAVNTFVLLTHSSPYAHTLSNGKQKHSSSISVFFFVLNSICRTVRLQGTCVHQKAQFVRRREKNTRPSLMLLCKFTNCPCKTRKENKTNSKPARENGSRWMN